MPRKIKQLITELEKAGFIDCGGKGNHKNFVHTNISKPITISGNSGQDAKKYQEKAVNKAIKEAKK